MRYKSISPLYLKIHWDIYYWSTRRLRGKGESLCGLAVLSVVMHVKHHSEGGRRGCISPWHCSHCWLLLIREGGVVILTRALSPGALNVFCARFVILQYLFRRPLMPSHLSVVCCLLSVVFVYMSSKLPLTAQSVHSRLHFEMYSMLKWTSTTTN